MLASGRSDRLTQDVFSGLPEAEAALVAGMTRRTLALAANRPLVGAGEIGIALYAIEEGWAFRYRRTGDACRQILDFLLPGEIVGLQAALLGLMEHSAQSLTPLRLTAYDPRLVGNAFAGTRALRCASPAMPPPRRAAARR